MLSRQMDIYKSVAAIDQDSEKKTIFSPIFTIFYFFLATSPLLFSATNKDNFNWLDVLDRQFYPLQIQSKRNFLHDAPFGRY